MTFEIQPGNSIGPVKLGMKRDELRKLLSEPYREIPAETLLEDGEKFELPAGDYFETSSIKVEYDGEQQVSFIEIGPLVKVLWKDCDVFETSCEDLFELICKADSSSELDDSGIYAYGIGLAAYAPHHEDEPGEPVELISVLPVDE
jgi:hypothetical protein